MPVGQLIVLALVVLAQTEVGECTKVLFTSHGAERHMERSRSLVRFLLRAHKGNVTAAETELVRF